MSRVEHFYDIEFAQSWTRHVFFLMCTLMWGVLIIRSVPMLLKVTRAFSLIIVLVAAVCRFGIDFAKDTWRLSSYTTRVHLRARLKPQYICMVMLSPVAAGLFYRI